MTSPGGNNDWEDLTAPVQPTAPTKPPVKGSGPFAVAHPVDGYAFTLDPESPELRYQRQPTVATPAIPAREAPKRIRDQIKVSGVWQPGGSAQAQHPQVKMPRPNVLTAILTGLIPLLLLGGGILLVMRLYGI